MCEISRSVRCKNREKYMSKKNKAGLGVVIRNGFGQVLASLSKHIQLPFFSDLVEAMTVVRALSFVAKFRFSRFVLEGDSKLIIKALQNKEDSLAPFGHILAATKTTIDFNCILFSHICKLGNSVAHNLAKHARHVAGLKVWMEDACSSTPLFYIVNRPWLIYFNEIQKKRKR